MAQYNYMLHEYTVMTTITVDFGLFNVNEV